MSDKFDYRLGRTAPPSAFNGGWGNNKPIDFEENRGPPWWVGALFVVIPLGIVLAVIL